MPRVPLIQPGAQPYRSTDIVPYRRSSADTAPGLQAYIATDATPRSRPSLVSEVYSRRRVNGYLRSLTELSQGISSILTQNPTDAKNAVIINFPAMPDSIELSRQANYSVLSTFTLPDGFHQYRGTDPLEIPLSFMLHAFDEEYCPHGALSLLFTAARLHALVLPIAPSGQQITTYSSGLAVEAGELPEAEKLRASAVPDPNKVTRTGGETSTYFPVAVLLDLIDAGNNMPGVRCVGYVRNVRTVFHGPWLNPPGIGKNLPTWLECAFTFIHRPSHTNRFGGAQNNAQLNPEIRLENVQAYADDIRRRLYNTANLTQDVIYQGFLS